MERRKSKTVKIGKYYIGGDNQIRIQSMTNTPSTDYSATYRQIKELENAGCEIVRMTVPDFESVKTISKLKESDINIPIVADIHFDYKMAIESAAAGADKIRINPGNIGSDEKVKKVVDACVLHNIPIRIGVNSGSLEKSILEKYGSPCAEALAESALYHASLLEKFGFDSIVIAVKSSRVGEMIKANEILAEKCSYPLHLGVTEAGTPHKGVIKSAVGIGSLLLRGIGDTFRVSLTGDPVEEIKEGKAILSSIGMNTEKCLNIVSCPTCGRTKIDLINIVKQFEKETEGLTFSKNINVAVMGCIVNGPGEAREADVGVAGGVGEAVLFKKGQIIRKIKEKDIIPELLKEIQIINEGN